MTKPIEWTTTETKTNTRKHRLAVEELDRDGRYAIVSRHATPSDLVAALAAMGEGERAEVLAAFHGDSIVHRHLQEQVERAEANHLSAVALVTELRHKLAAAEGCADACRAETRRIDAVCSDVQRERDGLRRSFNVAMTDCAKAAARAEKAEEETVEARASADRAWRAVSEARKEQLLAEGAQEKAERERDRSNHLRAGMLPDTRRELGALGCEDVAVAARRVVAERDSLRASNARYSKLADEALADRGEALADLESEARDAHDARCELEQLRTRLIAAETAAAQRDEARKELGTLHVERQAIAAALGLLPGERIGEGRLSIAARLACEERDELRVKNDGLRDCLKERKTICEDAIKRAIASETAAAQREPREYPLAEGSSWSGEVIIDGLGQTIRGTETALQISWGSTTRASVWQNVLALAHRRGLV